MSLEKIAVLILTAVIAVLLAVAIYKGTSGDENTPKPDKSAGPSAPVEQPKTDAKTVSLKDLRDDARRERDKRPDFDRARRGEYNTDFKGPKAPSDAGLKKNEAAPLTSVRVQRGDTFAKLAKRHLGSSAYAGRIKEANPGIEDRKLIAGQSIKVPVAAKKTPKATEPAAPAPVAGGAKKSSPVKAVPASERFIDVVILKGDTYAKIAKRVLGDAAKKDLVKRANKNLAESKLRYGEKIRIPAAAAAPSRGASATARLGNDVLVDETDPVRID